jgi:hypothetical protein
MPRASISMRELQKMSAGAIQALEGPITIRSGSAEVGVLYPISRAPQRDRGTVKHDLSEVIRLLEEADAKTPPEELERYARFLEEREREA